MKRILIILLVIGALTGLLAWRPWRGKPADDLSIKPGSLQATATVQRGDLKISVKTEGRISAKQSEKIAHTVDGQLTISKIVPEGKFVEKDEELVVFDDNKQKEALQTCEAALKTAETDMQIGERALEIARRENAEALSTAQFKYSAAKLDLEKCEKGDLPQTERGLLLKIEQAESNLKQAKESYDAITDKEMIAQGFVTPVEIEKERINLRSSQINLELAQGELEVFRTYTRPVTLNSKRADGETARANVAMIESVNANKLEQKKAELEAKQEKLRQAKNMLDEAKKKLAGCVLKAPVAGLVLYGEQHDNQYWYRQEENFRVGGQVYMNQTIITLPKLTELVVKANIAETDINKVKKGMQAIITADAYPNMREVGTIESTGNVASRNWMDATNQYPLNIDLRKGDLGIKPGVTTKVEIEITELKNVLQLPVTAVFTRDGRNIAYVKDGKITAREVKIGSANDLFVEIVSGLNEGETVLLYEPEQVELPPRSPADPAAKKDVEQKKGAIEKKDAAGAEATPATKPAIDVNIGGGK
ncbi:MAG TPA: HlyD family efflux transporter periplasmic adaptor subunit [Planctomycetota bacterium]